MNDHPYDIAVAYRIYPKSSSSKPAIFAEDKLKLAEFCLQSFQESLGSLKVKMFVLLNDCPPAFEEIFTKRWNAKDLVLIRYLGVPPGTTLHEQSRILMEQTDAPLVYFAEDDYFYLPGVFAEAVKFLKQNADADFVSLYEHPDLYTTDLHNLPRAKKQFGGREWSSCVSTTHTFLTSRKVLLENRGIFSRFGGQVNADLAMWMALTKKRVFNPVKFLTWLPAHKFWAGSIGYAWYYFWRQILFGRRQQLWLPHPSLATHMVATLEAQGVDWRREFQIRLEGK